MTVQLDELNMAVQTVFLGKLHIAILKPNILYGIPRNISLILPEPYELADGVKLEGIQE
jgi:hypothetical protein